MDTLDRIEQQIEINAPASKVWELVCEPGWYINDGALVEHRVERTGDLSVVHDPVHGPFAFQTVALDEPRYASFRWLEDPADPHSPSTLVEFWIEPVSAATVLLKVVESGLASMPGDAVQRRQRYEDNVQGWAMELELARQRLEERVDAAG